MTDCEYRGYVPGALGWVVELHGRYYAENWGLGLFFETKVAIELGELLNRFDERRDFFQVALADGRPAGAIAIDGSGGEAGEARLRFFIVDPARHGLGIGRELMRRAMEFCRGAGFARVYLWTFAGLDAARKLYEEFGFRLVLEHSDDQWGTALPEQMFEWRP